MSPGAAPRTSSLRTNTRNDLLSLYAEMASRTGEWTARPVVYDALVDRLRAAVLTGASNEQLAHIVLGGSDALDQIDARLSAAVQPTSPTTP